MNKKTIIISILIISLLLLSACKTKAKTPSAGFIGGKLGLVGSLVIESTSGGNKVFDSGIDLFKIDLTLENKGEDDIAEGEVLVTLDGINFDAFQLTDPTQSNTLPLLGLKREAGGITNPSQIIIQYDANYEPDEDADRNVVLGANICYAYETISRVADLCLKNRVTGPSGVNALCKIDETKQAENSGSPFQIKTFSERPAGEKKVNVYLEAENVGQGILYKDDYLAKGKCIESDADKNKVYAKVELLEYLDQSAAMIKCSGFTANE